MRLRAIVEGGPPACACRWRRYTRLLDYGETRSDPLAVKAVQDEVDALEKAGAWDWENVCAREEVERWARDNSVTVHIGLGLGICSIKYSELPRDKWVRKGRLCYRAPTARDESGALAIYQEMSSRPTTVVAMNVSIAWGAVKGHKTSVADAVKAYVQADLNSVNPTYIEIPSYLCGSRWRNIKRPVSRLLKALYGHPEAGAHWERHLAQIIRSMGGQVLPAHPSCFFPQIGSY